MELTEILKQVEGFTPPDVTVTIEKVFAYKSGDGDRGPWSFQDIKVNGGTLKLKNIMRPFPESHVGRTVTIRANQSKQHGLTGLKVNHEQYNNNIYHKLVITSSAKWDWAGAANNSDGSHAPVATQNGAINESAYTDHLLSCAELANLVTAKLEIEDAQAVQACFATICIDTKNRNLLLPKPKTLAAPSDEQGDPHGDEPPYGEPPPDSQFEEDDIPF